jgi:hypothetical protein
MKTLDRNRSRKPNGPQETTEMNGCHASGSNLAMQCISAYDLGNRIIDSSHSDQPTTSDSEPSEQSTKNVKNEGHISSSQHGAFAQNPPTASKNQTRFATGGLFTCRLMRIHGARF